MSDALVYIPDNFDPTEDFDKLNPQVKYISPFSELYESELDYSNSMWSIVFLMEADAAQNKLYRLPLPERIEAIQRFYPNFNPELELLKTCIEAYPYKCIPALRKSLIETKEFLISRSQYLKSVEYRLETMKDIDMAMSKSGKLWEDFEKIQEKYESAKKDSSEVYGGRTESFAEKKKL